MAEGTPDFRVGHGWDLHRLEPPPPQGNGRPLVIGGVRFEHDHGPVAHSDGDVLLHAITDALLGAIAADDLGSLFPDDDDAHESRDSADFIAEARRRIEAAGWSLVNLDTTVVLQRPRIGPRRGEIRANIARLLGVDPTRVNVKDKSHERVDAIGDGRAIAAHAVVLLQRS
ncbi:MAG: 2-C-methyl-D-erythritol 2,4-cyclodiphosphate synthase [Planctomycetota bacterium]